MMKLKKLVRLSILDWRTSAVREVACHPRASSSRGMSVISRRPRGCD